MFPFAIIDSAGRKIEKIFRKFAKQINEQIFPMLPSIPKSEGIKLDAGSVLELLQELRKRQGQYIDQEVLQAAIENHLELLDAWSVGQLNQTLEAQRQALLNQGVSLDEVDKRIPLIPKVDPARSSRIPLASQRAQLLQNAAYAGYFNEVEDIITDGILKGTDKDKIVEQILNKVDMNAARARFWVEDQLSIFQAEQKRIAAIRGGYTHYRWKKGGANSRASHAIHDGQIYSWNVGVNNLTRPGARHPGEDYRCHCEALPVTQAEFNNLGIINPPPRESQSTKGLVENYEGSEESKVEKGKPAQTLSSFFGNWFRKKSDSSSVPSLPKRGAASFASYEEILRGEFETEIAYIEINGQVLKFLGDLNSVTIPGNLKLEGSVALHNHRYGGSFSLDDFLFLVKNNLSEIRAVTSDRVFVLSLNKRLSIDQIVKLRKYGEKLYSKFEDRVNVYLLEGMSYQDASLKVSHEISEELANKFSLNYKAYEY